MEYPSVGSPQPAGEPIGLMHTWWRGDPLPALPPLPGLAIAPTDDAQLIAGLCALDDAEIRRRLERNHRAWLAVLAGEPVGYGWVATTEATIGGLGDTLALPAANRYLWDFVTLPAWRGRGIYPRLLQAIVRHGPETERFWIGHDAPNVASQRGIAKAGFSATVTLYRTADGRFAFVPSGSIERAVATSALLHVPLAGLNDRGGA
jgi:GNAT superfamily N-acetyltransferase